MAEAVKMAHRMQSEALEAFGFEVKNTFIDSCTFSEDICDSRASRRSRSLPITPSSEVSESRGVWNVQGQYGDDKYAQTHSSPKSSMSSTSVSCWSRERSPATSLLDGSDETSPSEADGSETSRESSFCDEEEHLAAEELGTLVVRECSFLRVTGFGLHEESNRVRRQRGAAKCVMLYVKSLPWAKRAKWLHPLLRSVAALLQAKGCATKMQGGELYAKLGSSRNLARLDFAAARCY
jgi:hypothetical protein